MNSDLAGEPDATPPPDVVVPASELQRILEHASPPHERHSQAFILGEVGAESAERMSRWQKGAASDERELFDRRLGAEGWSRKHAERLLAEPRWAGRAPFPAWMATLERALNLAGARAERMRAQAEAHDATPVEQTAPAIPFEELLLPFLAIAREGLAIPIASLGDQLTVSAQASLENHFLTHLSSLAALPLAGEFGRYRSEHSSGSEPTPPGRRLYLGFVAEMYSGGLLEFFGKYPVLARLLAEQTSVWIERIDELLKRLRLDKQALTDQLFFGRDPGPLVDASPFLSDLHHGGRSVVGLLFASGERAVYKPHSVEVESAWFGLLQWINVQSGASHWKTLRTLPRQGYGYVEFCDAAECSSRKGVRLYYKRLGMLIGLVHALQGTDCHYENLIASGEHPVLVDVETLFYPRVTPDLQDSDSDAILRSQDILTSGVLGTGLLPAFETTPEGQTQDVGGISAGLQQTPLKISQWEHANTDGIEFVEALVQPDSGTNVPRCEGQPIPPEEFEAEILSGFQEVSQFLIEHREQIVAPDGPLAAFRRVRTRYIFRNTKVYARILQQSLHPRFLADAADRFIHLDTLSRPLLGDTRLRAFWAILDEERRALERLDVPRFEISPDDVDLVLSTGCMQSAFAMPGFSRVVAHVLHLDQSQIDEQCALIRISLYARTSRFIDDMTRFRRLSHPRIPEPRSPEKSSQRFLEAALRIADRLVENAVLGNDGTANWLAPAYLSAGQRTCVQPLQQGLYDGLTGVGVFLAAAARVGRRVEHRELAMASFSSVTRQLAVPVAARRLRRNIGLGAGNGLASLVYGLTLAAKLVDEESLLDAAVQAARLIDAEMLENDRSYDVMGGSAGAILALLTLAEATGDHRWIPVARRAGERLLESSVEANDGGRAWRTVANKLRTGFSHGASGIALALRRLSAQTADVWMNRLAEDALEFEAAQYRASAQNWACVATEDCGPGDDQLLTSWCYGAPGIGLARLALSSCNGLDNDNLLLTRDLTCAVEGTYRSDFCGFDHICCGNFGRIELLWEAGRRNMNADWSETALTLADRLIRRAERDGRWHLLEELPGEAHLPGLFLGEAGIGYQLLRLADPERVPSVLMFAL